MLFASLMVCSCSDIEDKMKLERECSSLRREILGSQEEITKLNTEVNNLRSEKSALMAGKEPIYILTFQIKQGTFTLDLSEHIKNEMNSITIEIPVTKEYYNSVGVGQDIKNDFKFGSLVVDGDFSKLHVRCKGKRIVY